MTNNREILVAITFREFSDDYNSRIQERCIESIANQTYENFRLVITTYGEKDPGSIVEKYTDKYVIYEENNNKSYFFQTIQNCIDLSKKGDNIILWTNADNIFDKNFFYEMIKNFKPKQAGTSYPNFHYYNLDDYCENRPNTLFDYKNGVGRPLLKKRKYIKSFFNYDLNVFISEAQYIDADVLLSKKCIYEDMLPLEHIPGIGIFLAFSSLANTHMNLIFKSKIHVIENSRVFGAKSRDKCNDFSDYSHSIAEGKLERFSKYNDALDKIIDFAKTKDVNQKFYKSSYACSRKYSMHSCYHPVGKMYQIVYYYFYKLCWFLFPKKKFKILRLYEIINTKLKRG